MEYIVRSGRLLAEVSRDPDGMPADGYAGLLAAVRHGPDWVPTELLRSGLRGRGGAGFPTGRKWSAVAAAPAPRRVLLNGAEAEPLSWKDRWLLRHRPHLVLEGALLAAVSVEATSVHCYISDPDGRRALERAARQAHDAGILADAGCDDVDIVVVAAPTTYVAGEETAAVHYINGGPPFPTVKPPSAWQSGIDGRPTLVNNVETLAHAAHVARYGASWFREVGTPSSPGAFLCCLTGAVDRPGLYELPLGISLAELLAAAGGGRPPRAVLMGGCFGGLLPPTAVSVALDYESLRDLYHSGLGNGSIHVVGQDACPIAIASDIFRFFELESARQCGICVAATSSVAQAGARLRSSQATPRDLQTLDAASSLRRRGACQLLDGVAILADTLLRHFRPDVEAHTNRSTCAECQGGTADARKPLRTMV